MSGDWSSCLSANSSKKRLVFSYKNQYHHLKHLKSFRFGENSPLDGFENGILIKKSWQSGGARSDIDESEELCWSFKSSCIQINGYVDMAKAVNPLLNALNYLTTCYDEVEIISTPMKQTRIVRWADQRAIRYHCFTNFLLTFTSTVLPLIRGLRVPESLKLSII
jgi:hypothetical protein